MGIEPTAQAWEAWVLPLYDARNGNESYPNHECAATLFAVAPQLAWAECVAIYL